MFKSLSAAAALLMPCAAGAQAMPGMDMPGMSHGSHTAPKARPKAPAKRRTQAPPAQEAKGKPNTARSAKQRVLDVPPTPPESAAEVAPDGSADQPPPPAVQSPAPPPATDVPAMDHHAMEHGDAGTIEPAQHHAMQGALGRYPMTRDGSGTSWQPGSTPHMGTMGLLGGAWSGMAHGNATLVWDRQGGPRGETKTFVSSMIMGMAQRPLGSGTLTLKAMGSLDPLMGKRGYPLLLATGETADGRTELVDRQHPHDAIAELSATLSHPFGGGTSGFAYLAYPGEPALGPTAYLHRFSGMANPEAPISHHYLDSTHVTFGVATAGIVGGPWKVEASLFTGREPDERRWNVEKPRLDSWAVRATFNTAPDWSFQLSRGRLNSPEKLHPNEDVRRTTASATWNQPLSAGNWQTTLAWGRNRTLGGEDGGAARDAVLLESAADIGRWGMFARGEVAEKSDLFGDEHDGSSQPGRSFTVGKLSVGGYRSVPLGSVTLDVGGLVSKFALPAALKPDYGRHPTGIMLFTRVRLGR